MPEASLTVAPRSAPARWLFVYGTLRAGGRNDIVRRHPAARLVGRGSIDGVLYDLGTYPGAALGGATTIEGEVYRIDAAIEAALDVLEEVRPDDEGEYRKRQVTVEVNGRPLDCLVYEIHPQRCAGHSVIAGGDWIAYWLRRQRERFS